MLGKVYSHLKEWQDKQYRPVRIAVKISPQQFQKGNFANKVLDMISEYGIKTSALEVEITQSALTRILETPATLNTAKNQY